MPILRRSRNNQGMTKNKRSAGILLYRPGQSGPEVFLVHPGGPFWKKKDTGAWTIPKGEIGEGEEPLSAAKREFEEETGHAVNGEFIPLQPVRQKAGKLILAWAVLGDLDVGSIRSNTFQIEWPYKSGRVHSFFEIDKAGWFTASEAVVKINPAQAALIDQLIHYLDTVK